MKKGVFFVFVFLMIFSLGLISSQSCVRDQSESKEIKLGSAEKFLDISLFLEKIEKKSSGSSLQIILESVTDTNYPNKRELSQEFPSVPFIIDDYTYQMDLINISNSSAIIKVTCGGQINTGSGDEELEQGNLICQDGVVNKEIIKGTTQTLNGIPITLVESVESETFLSATLKFSEIETFILTSENFSKTFGLSASGQKTYNYKLSLLATTDSSAILKSECALIEITPTEETGPIEIPETTNSNPAQLCNGCFMGEGSACYPYGYREEGSYCALGGFISQLGAGSSCENHFECSSNLCIENQCVSQSLIQKIMAWVRNLFG